MNDRPAQDSNPRSLACKASTLPTELFQEDKSQRRCAINYGKDSPNYEAITKGIPTSKTKSKKNKKNRHKPDDKERISQLKKQKQKIN